MLPVVTDEVDLMVAVQLARHPSAVAGVVGVEQRRDVLQRGGRLDDRDRLDRGAEEQVRARADGALARQLADHRDQDVRADLRGEMAGGEDVQPPSRRAEIEIVTVRRRGSG